VDDDAIVMTFNENASYQLVIGLQQVQQLRTSTVTEILVLLYGFWACVIGPKAQMCCLNCL